VARALPSMAAAGVLCGASNGATLGTARLIGWWALMCTGPQEVGASRFGSII
jgi:hypothetical protein